MMTRDELIECWYRVRRKVRLERDKRGWLATYGGNLTVENFIWLIEMEYEYGELV